ncbi:MAG: hypothetical protein GY756_05210 [bacterium]|nr:hypothetical protein [bacterium]
MSQGVTLSCINSPFQGCVKGGTHPKNLVDLRDVELVTFKELVSKTCGNYGKITDIALINITKNGRYYLMESKQEIKESHNDRIIINKIKQDIKNLFRDSKTPAGGSHIYKKHICLF